MGKIDFSYASSVEHNFAQRLIIKTIERVTGKKKLEKFMTTLLKKKCVFFHMVTLAYFG